MCVCLWEGGALGPPTPLPPLDLSLAYNITKYITLNEKSLLNGGNMVDIDYAYILLVS